jgi:hypothetical protein
MERKLYPSDVRDDAWALQGERSMRWVLRSLLLGVLTCWLVACASLDTTTTPYAGAPPYPPGDPASVQILRTQPTQPHDRLGEIIVDTPWVRMSWAGIGTRASKRLPNAIRSG